MAGGRQRRLSQLEVLGAVVVHDQQPITGGLDVVLNALASRRDDPRLALRIIGAEQPEFRGDLAAGSEDDPAIIAACVYAQPVTLVSLGQYLDVLRRVVVPSRCRRTTYGRQASSALV